MTLSHLLVGGIQLDIFSSALNSSNRPVSVVFLLHSRPKSKQDIAYFAEELINSTTNLSTPTTNDLIVVTFDHRNHGARVIDARANQGWSTDPKQHNPSHALDMYSIQHGTAHDVSFLIDHLPFHLYPNEERTIANWSVIGVSLGGHSTWISLVNDPRITIGIPIIGCLDYESLILERAQKIQTPQFQIPINTLVPPALLTTIRRIDPIVKAKQGKPFSGKKILVLCGEKDTMVPWSHSEKFVMNDDRLDVGLDGVKEVYIQPDTGHKCKPEMVDKAIAFIQKYALQ